MRGGETDQTETETEEDGDIDALHCARERLYADEQRVDSVTFLLKKTKQQPFSSTRVISTVDAHACTTRTFRDALGTPRV